MKLKINWLLLIFSLGLIAMTTLAILYCIDQLKDNHDIKSISFWGVLSLIIIEQLIKCFNELSKSIKYKNKK